MSSRFASTVQSTREGVGIAWDALRSNKVRAALTILGIVIGVATVMAMAAIITGIRSSVTGELEALGPKNFIVERWDQTQIQFGGGGSGRRPWEGKPPITLDEAQTIRAISSVQSVTVSVNAMADLRFGNQTVSGVMVLGRSADWVNYDQGDFIAGRNYLPSDERRAAPVVVLSEKLSESVFGPINPIGRRIRLGNEQFEVIGVYRQPANLFSGSIPAWAITPHTTAFKHLGASPFGTSLLVVPDAAATQEAAMDDVTAALRTVRGLRPADENNFALIRQEAFLELFDRLTGVIFLVMLVLSSIGLMVGGVGVVAIMMISVSERTREIGVRKALGATRREILWQFLVEAVTVTVIGATIGLILGGGGAMLLGAVTPIPASVPLWSIAAALGVSALCGIGFGMYPANKAARLDPVEALRYE
jgi:putative ABC transport system permease protein